MGVINYFEDLRHYFHEKAKNINHIKQQQIGLI